MAEPDPKSKEILLQKLLHEIRKSHKYSRLEIPEETLHDLLAQALARQPNPKAAFNTVREKLHNIVAPYLGDPPYDQAAIKLSAVYASQEDQQIRATCLELLASHASTRERIPLLERFYPRLWEVTGRPACVLDLACGLHPFGLPWMCLPSEASYNAYDINAPRVGLINHFFRLSGQSGIACQQDILVNPPGLKADVAFFFKEAHRFEQRQRGCNLPFWNSLNVRWLLVSLPAVSLTGRRDLVERQQNLVHGILQGSSWPVIEIRFDNELVFCIQKHE